MKTAIVYFSRSGNNWFNGGVKYLTEGNTKVLAKKIQQLTKGDLFELKMKEPYSEDYDQCVEQAREDLLQNKECELIQYPDLSSYDIIYFGFPIYWGDMPIAVSSYLKIKPLQNKIIHPFVTHEGSGLGISVAHIKDLLPQSKVKRPFPLPGSLILECEDLIENWIKGNIENDLK